MGGVSGPIKNQRQYDLEIEPLTISTGMPSARIIPLSLLRSSLTTSASRCAVWPFLSNLLKFAARPRAVADVLRVRPDVDFGVPGRLPEYVLRGDGRSTGLGDPFGELRGLGRGENGIREAI